MIPLPIVISNPFVPDLIHEESHGMGNMLRTNVINLGLLSSYALLLLNATKWPIFGANVIFLSNASLLLLVCLFVKIGMKDVIKEEGAMTESVS